MYYTPIIIKVNEKEIDFFFFYDKMGRKRKNNLVIGELKEEKRKLWEKKPISIEIG